MYHAISCIKKIAQLTNEVILFHSGAGKDSIALLDLCSPYFKRVVCVYMYMVKDLEHINKYIIWAKNKYPNAEFLEVPHYALSQYIRDGYLGCRKNPKQRVYQLNHIVNMVKKNTGIQWAIFGFKQSDSMNRRLMLRTYEDESIYTKTQNAYPLSKYKNKDVQAYIKYKKLVPPIVYGKGQSQGCDVSSSAFLWYCKTYHPNDYQKIIKEFPATERILFEALNYNPQYEN
ncbi:phosphoadenosine phosphosulfate reductase domain-containing protein [Capnocytophaga canimorsus]|uniref:phosphoadenosine phosphosulfate reductase domain-containing protein n=1 Tax=Capnocytophaga canimorsus TaxID=28188 RepID=UPI0037CDCF1F